MQVKVFESPDMASGLKMVRKELGAEALILSTRSIKNPKLGILGKPMLEITAAIDSPIDDPTSPQAVVAATPSYRRKSSAHHPAPFFNKGRNNDLDQRIKSNCFTLEPSSPRTDASVSPGEVERQETIPEGDGVKGEIDDLKQMITRLSQEISCLQTAKQEPESAQHPSDKQEAANTDDDLFHLSSYGIGSDTAGIMMNLARQRLSASEIADKENLTSFYRELVGGFIKVDPPLLSSGAVQRRIAFIGPTGVGKTTTLAKIAALCLAHRDLSIGLITIDTYRIAAVEQLKVYGEIMGMSVDVVLTPGQLEKAINRHQDKDVLLIDTAGRNPRDLMSIDELSSFFPHDLEIEKYLVLSAATKEPELKEAISHFQKLDLDRTIFTKIDECCTLGTILNIQLNNPSPLAFLTNGQRVPEDLIEIDSEKIATLIIPSE